MGYNREVNQFLSVVMLIFGVGFLLSFVMCGVDVATVADRRAEAEPSGWGLDATADAIDRAGRPEAPVRFEEDELAVPGVWVPPSEAADAGAGVEPALLAAAAGLATLAGMGVIGWALFLRAPRAPRPEAGRALAPELAALYAFEAEQEATGRKPPPVDHGRLIPVPFAGGCFGVAVLMMGTLIVLGPMNVAFMIGTYFDEPATEVDPHNPFVGLFPDPNAPPPARLGTKAERVAARKQALERARRSTENTFLGSHQPEAEVPQSPPPPPWVMAGVAGVGVLLVCSALGLILFGGRRDPPG